MRGQSITPRLFYEDAPSIYQLIIIPRRHLSLFLPPVCAHRDAHAHHKDINKNVVAYFTFTHLFHPSPLSLIADTLKAQVAGEYLCG